MTSVYINGSLVAHKEGLQVTELFNETLDTGLVIIPQVDVMDIEPMDEVTITDTGYTKYMLVSHVKGNVINFVAPRKYNYTLELISPTIKLQRITMPNRSITQPLTGTKKTIWDVISNYRDIYYPGATLTSALETKTDSTNCPELQWNQPTFFEVMNDLLSVVDCIVTMTDFDTISYLDLKLQGSAINTAYINNFETNRGIEEYANRIEIEAKNAVYKKRNTQTYEVVIPRTTQGAVITEDNLELIMHKPIYTIEEVICVYYNSYYEERKEIDITNYVVEKKVYDTYKNSISPDLVTGTDYKRNAIYFTEGDNVIRGLGYTEGTWVPVLTTQRAILNILNNEEEQFYVIGEGIFNLGFEIKYTTIEDVKFISEKDVPNTHNSVLINNQSTSYVDISALANNQQQTVNRIGNQENQLYGRYPTYASIPALADTYDTDYILVSRQIIFRKEYYEFTGQVLKYYVMKNLYTGLNSKKRYLQLASGNDSFISNHLTVVKSQFTKTSGTEDYVLENYLLKFATADMFPKLAYCEVNLKDTYNTIKLGLAGSGYMLPKSIIYNIAFPDNYNAGMRVDKEDLFLGLGALAVVYTPYVDSDGEFESIEVVLYKDFTNPNFASGSMTLDPDAIAALNRARDYPIIDASLLDMDDIVFETGPLLRYKDNREITSETMQFLFTSDSDIFIGDQYYLDNPFVFIDATKTLYVYTSPTLTYSVGDQDALGSVLGTGVTISLNSISSAVSDATWAATTIASWCIADSSGNIYLATNGNDRYIYLVSDTNFYRIVAQQTLDIKADIDVDYWRSTDIVADQEFNIAANILYSYWKSSNFSTQLIYNILSDINYSYIKSTDFVVELSDNSTVTIVASGYQRQTSFGTGALDVVADIDYSYIKSTDLSGTGVLGITSSMNYGYTRTTNVVGTGELNAVADIDYGYYRSLELSGTGALGIVESMVATRMNTVKFYDWDDTLLKSEEVPYGQDATPPADPTRTGYIFDVWSPGYTNVIDDVVTYAQYNYAPLEPTIAYDSKTLTSLSFYITNNSPYACTVYYEQNDITPDANSVELGAGVTSSLLTISGLQNNVEYTVYAQAWIGIYSSSVDSFIETTPTLTAPTITYVSKTGYLLRFTFTNNYSAAARIYYDLDDTTPDLAYVDLAAGATSVTLTITGLTPLTEYTCYARAYLDGTYSLNDTDIQTTDTRDTTAPTIEMIGCETDGSDTYYDITWIVYNNDVATVSVVTEANDTTPDLYTDASVLSLMYSSQFTQRVYSAGKIYATAQASGAKTSAVVELDYSITFCSIV